MSAEGKVIRVAGPVVEASNMSLAVMHELVMVGTERLVGEIIRLDGEKATIQVYQNTSGLKLNETVVGSGNPLSVELAPGLVGNVFDGIQRPLEVLKQISGPFIKHTQSVFPLSREKKWSFVPSVKVGAVVSTGDILGIVKETELVEHRIMVPPNVQGKISSIARPGQYVITETIATIEANSGKIEVQMLQKWPVRQPRPYSRRLLATLPLITGQRVIDTFFPIAKGGSAANSISCARCWICRGI